MTTRTQLRRSPSQPPVLRWQSQVQQQGPVADNEVFGARPILVCGRLVPDLPQHSAADIPATRVVAGVRIGLLEGEGFVVNPTVQQMETSSLDLLLAGSASAVLMIEGFADFLPEEQLLEVCES